MTFRKNLKDYELDLKNLDSIITIIDKLNKEQKVNLVIIKSWKIKIHFLKVLKTIY